MSLWKRVRRAWKAYRVGKLYGMGPKKLRRVMWQHFWKETK